MDVTSNNQQNESSTMVKSKILLKDGTELNLKINGSEYESDTIIEDNVLSEDNLSVVSIDGVSMGKMICFSKYSYNNGTRFSLREQTDEEKTIDALRSELTMTQAGLAEAYELLVSLMQ